MSDVSLAGRVGRLERGSSFAAKGWRLADAPTPPPDPDGDDVWAVLMRIRDSYPDPVVRNKSLMDMAEDLVPGFKQRVEEEGAAYQASHEWRWINGRCYVRERPELRR